MDEAPAFDAFATLGLPRQLDLPEEDVEAAWQRLSRELHPDTAETGDAARAAEVNRARDTLATPSRRLRHWLELRGVALPRHGAVDDELMALFSETASVLAEADAVLSKQSGATTALAKALIAEPAFAALARLQTLLGRLKQESEAVTVRFRDIAEDDSAALKALARLGFLEKWESQCRERLLAFLAS